MDFRKGEIIAIDKPYRMSSFGALAHVRYLLSKKLGFKVKIGHAGTLDPLATGVLVLCTGKCTKQIEQLQTHTKEYTPILRSISPASWWRKRLSSLWARFSRFRLPTVP